MVEGMSIREAARTFGLHRDTVRKMTAYSAPPGYRRQVPPRRPKLESFTGVIDRILESDLSVPRKQRHTAKRIFERLRDEYGFGGQYTIVKDYVREHRRRSQEMFVPLSHAPGHAQCDFGEAVVIIGGVEQKAHCFVLDLPHSDGCFIKAYPGGTTEAFLDGHVSAIAFLGGVPQSILYDNTKLAVARILGDGRRKRTRTTVIVGKWGSARVSAPRTPPPRGPLRSCRGGWLSSPQTPPYGTAAPVGLAFTAESRGKGTTAITAGANAVAPRGGSTTPFTSASRAHAGRPAFSRCPSHTTPTARG